MKVEPCADPELGRGLPPGVKPQGYVLEAGELPELELEALLALGIVDAADVDQHLELAQRVVVQRLEHGDNPVARDVHGQLAAHDLPTLDGTAELGLDVFG